MYEMIDGIDVLNEKTGEIGKAVEYSYESMFAYRYKKCPDVVCVDVNGERQVWRLKDCRPKEPT